MDWQRVASAWQTPVMGVILPDGAGLRPPLMLSMFFAVRYFLARPLTAADTCRWNGDGSSVTLTW